MLDVGLTAMLTTRSWPEEMPPSVPPAWLDRNPCGVSSSRCSEPRCATLRETCADLDALDGVDAHHRVRQVRVETIEHGLAEARVAIPWRRP